MPGGKYCCVKECKSTRYNYKRLISFPKNANLRQQWMLTFISKYGKVHRKGLYVCEKHLQDAQKKTHTPAASKAYSGIKTLSCPSLSLNNSAREIDSDLEVVPMDEEVSFEIIEISEDEKENIEVTSPKK